MEKDQIFILKDRGIIYINGEDAKEFLQNIVTNDINKVTENKSDKNLSKELVSNSLSTINWMNKLVNFSNISIGSIFYFFKFFLINELSESFIFFH